MYSVAIVRSRDAAWQATARKNESSRSSSSTFHGSPPMANRAAAGQSDRRIGTNNDGVRKIGIWRKQPTAEVLCATLRNELAVLFVFLSGETGRIR